MTGTRRKPRGRRLPSPPRHGPGDGSNPIRTSYEPSVAEARGLLLGVIDENVKRLENDSGPDKRKVAEAVSRLKDAKGSFEKYGLVPGAKELWSNTSAYLRAVAEARAKVLAS